jgi:hypothetical protein
MNLAEKQSGIERDVESDTSLETGKVLAHDGTESLHFFLAAFL